MTPRQAVQALNKYGSPAVLAHPRYCKDLPTVLAEVKDSGAAGMEVYYKDSDEALVASMAALAKQYGLLPLGGSDYHALPRPDEREPGNIPLPDSVARAFLEQQLPWVPTRGLT